MRRIDKITAQRRHADHPRASTSSLTQIEEVLLRHDKLCGHHQPVLTREGHLTSSPSAPSCALSSPDGIGQGLRRQIGEEVRTRSRASVGISAEIEIPTPTASSAPRSAKRA